MAVEKLNFTRDWNRPEDFPPVARDVTQARANIQYLYDEIRTYINETVVAELGRLDSGKAGSTALQEVRAAQEFHQNNKGNPHAVTCQQLGAEEKGTAARLVQEHNENETAHGGVFVTRTELNDRLKEEETNVNQPLEGEASVLLRQWRSGTGMACVSGALTVPQGIRGEMACGRLAYPPLNEIRITALSDNNRLLVFRLAADGSVTVRRADEGGEAVRNCRFAAAYHC